MSTLSAESAQELADEILFPTANEIDAMDVLPRERLDLLADRGWYGLSAPSSGIDIVSGRPIVEAFAGGCLTTSLVWMQHLGQPPACAFGAEHLRVWLEPLASGEIRSTVAYAGLRPDAPLRARQEGDDWVLDGVAPWVSGWGLTTMIHVAARTPEDDVVWLLADARVPGMRADRHRLLALDASATVTLYFDGVRVAGDRLTSRFPWAEWPERDAMGLRTNGSLALGLAARCLRLLGPSSLDDELVTVREDLDAGDATTFPAGRAAACELAVRAASTLLVSQGSGSVERGAHAERLYREAGMLLVFGSRPSIRGALLTALG